METGRRAAGEQHAVDITIFQQRTAGGFSALQQVDRPVGMPACCHSWTVISAVAGVSSLGLNTMVFPAISAGMICPLGRWPGSCRAKDHHAVRFVAQQRFTVRQRRLMKARPLVIGLDGDRGLADHRLHFGAGLPQRLAGLAGNQGRQRLFMRLQQRGKTLYDVNTLGQRPVRPEDKTPRARAQAARTSSAPRWPPATAATDPPGPVCSSLRRCPAATARL